MGNQATLVVTIFDDAGVQLSGRQISYDSSDPFAVSVSSAGVVSAHREGTARITATSEGRSDFSDVTAGLRPLEPTEDTELQGDSIELKTVVIPLGVTVTVIGDIDLIVQGVIDIAGTLQSDCGKLGLKSSSTVQISGTVQNGCATQGQGDSLKVEADGGLTLDGGTLISSGVLQLVSVLSGIGGGTGPARSVRAAGDCVIHDTELRSADADPGGSGGMIRMVVGGDILFGVDSGATVRSGDGGAGGTATATANHPSSSATTVAGDGGDSGGVIVSVGTGNGGRGGSGAPPGAGGAAGADGIVAVNGRSDVGTTFANGQLGESCGVTPVASVLVTPSAPNILVGGEVQLGADPQDSEGASLQGRVVTWATDDAGVASVSATGLVTGASEGSATITATSEGIDGTAEVTVSDVAVASVVVTPSAPNILVGGEVQLGADPQDSEGASLQGRVVTWATDDAGVASVSATGLVTGASEGSATITATSEGIDGTAEVTVTPAGEPPIACGDLISGSITAAGEFHEYEFTGSTGDFITITLSESSFGTSSAHDARVTLYAPSDALVGSFDSDSQADFTLGETGTFVLRVNANNFVSTGSYELVLIKN